MFHAKTFMHHVDVEVAPAAIWDALRPAIDLGPIPLFQLAAHHASDLGGEEPVQQLALGWRESRKCPRWGHNQKRSVCVPLAAMVATTGLACLRNSSNPIAVPFSASFSASHSACSLRKSHSSMRAT
jgi:hypothetical protein